MAPFTTLTSIAAPLIRPNIDTDAIIPSREMRSVSKTGLADGLFAGWRYRSIGGRDPDPAFVLNDPAYAGARILLAGENFGCGSSREHAAWALAEFGFRAVIAPSFNPIFEGNCVRNGIAPIRLARAAIDDLAAAVASNPRSHLVTIDLPEQIVRVGDQAPVAFQMPEEAKAMLVHGLDAIDLTLAAKDDIAAFVENDRATRPWAYL